MPGEINCLFTKGLIPFVEKESGPEGVAALCRAAGGPRDYLMADHNWLPLTLANELVQVAMELVGETDVERWARRFADDMMDWKPSRSKYRHYLGTYSMGIGNPRCALSLDDGGARQPPVGRVPLERDVPPDAKPPGHAVAATRRPPEGSLAALDQHVVPAEALDRRRQHGVPLVQARRGFPIPIE